jgi:DDE family transposase
MPKPSTQSKKSKPNFPPVDKALSQLVQVLPRQWKSLMVELGAFYYGNRIRTPEQLLRAILMYCGMDLSLLELSLVMRFDGIEISRQGLCKRLNRCAAFLEWLNKETLGMQEPPALPEHRRFLACDGTELSRSSPHSPRLRLHLCIDLLSLRFVQVRLTMSKQGESLKKFEFRRGDVVLADRNFCRYQSVLYAKLDCGADLLVRWQSHFPVYESPSAEQPLSLHQKLQGQAEKSITSFPVWIKYSAKSKEKNKRELGGHLHIYRMTKDEAELSKRKLIKNGKRKNRTVSKEAEFLSQFVILFTTVPPSEISPEVAIALYRCRWQIELAFKNLKSLLHIEHFRTHPESQLTQVYIWGKLLYALLIDSKLRKALAQDWTSLSSPSRFLALWCPTRLAKRQLDASLLRAERWQLGALASRPKALAQSQHRRRALQTLPPALLLPPSHQPQATSSSCRASVVALHPPNASGHRQLLLNFGDSLAYA